MTTDDTLARARAVVAGLREAEGKATPGPWVRGEYAMDECEITSEACDDRNHPLLHIYDEGGHSVADAAAIVALRNAAPALIRLAEAVADLVGECEEPWWSYRAASWGDPIPTCIGCGAEHPSWCFDEPWKHDGRCLALAIDAALADLAALAPQESSDA